MGEENKSGAPRNYMLCQPGDIGLELVSNIRVSSRRCRALLIVIEAASLNNFDRRIRISREDLGKLIIRTSKPSV